MVCPSKFLSIGFAMKYIQLSLERVSLQHSPMLVISTICSLLWGIVFILGGLNIVVRDERDEAKPT